MQSKHPEPSESVNNSVTLHKFLQYADEQKKEGNDYFRARKWEEALAAYRAGLGHLPKRRSAKVPQKQPSHGDEEVFGNVQQSSQGSKEDEAEEVEVQEDPECVKARAVLNANIAACYVKLVSPTSIFPSIYLIVFA